MTHRASLLLVALPLFAQTPPDITGVWRANLAKSAIPGPAPAEYLVIITRKDSALTIKTLIVRTPANTKNTATYDPSTAQTSNWIRGNPTKSHATWEGSTLKIASSFTFAGALQSYQDEWTLSSDGTLSNIHTQAPAPVARVIFEKQPLETAADFDQPEKTARDAYQNVQALNVPASSLLSIMNTYCLSLGVACNHCHINGQWSKDDVPAKATARKMIAMTRALNVDNFAPRVGVSCYTCHRGNAKPLTIPLE
ncbi:MAG TPA: photosynthetic reaction center cytochrome c subunit family protein [Bryobacteraceae bacterium]|nr:photosynthetic reaction center cytochrome c subunit family protein [Bryobacteraceae bacterium]